MQDTQETQDRSLGRGDRLQKEMATQSQYSCQENPWTGEPVFLAAVGTSPSPYLSSCPPTRSHYFQNILLMLFLLYPLLARKVVYITIFFCYIYYKKTV